MSVIVIEHNLDVIKNADWIIDMGPEGGNKGGKVIFERTPKQLIQAKQSLTGTYLKIIFKIPKGRLKKIFFSIACRINDMIKCLL